MVKKWIMQIENACKLSKRLVNKARESYND